ncbi:MAG: HAMP domain-containing histidine kinase, partial [Firmicutes bacterium]|nr:HAMP domain-containing histidine kinase [Bacillota bacterium]
RFYKGKRGNYGLGLSISKEAIEKHSGKITARNSEETGGAEIIVYLPLRKVE